MRRLSFYVSGESVLHRLHPSSKLVAYVIGFVFASVLPWPSRWLLAGVIFGALALCGVPPARYRAALVLTVIATLTVPLLNGLWPVPGDPLIHPLWGSFGFHAQGLISGLAFAGLYAATSMLTIAILTTTRSWELAEAPTMLGVHHAVGFALAYALRIMPEIGEHYLDLRDVWRTRGVDFGHGWPAHRFWLHCRLLAALLILEFVQVRAKSNAVEARGFSLSRRPTYYMLPPVPGGQRLGLAAAALAVLTIAVVQSR